MVNGHVEQDVNPGPNCSRQVFAVENEVHGLVRLGYSKVKLGLEGRVGREGGIFRRRRGE